MENNIEMIEKIENMLNTERRNRRGNREIRFEVNSNYYEAVSKLLSDYKRVLKENEEKNKIIDLMAEFFNKRSWREHQLKDDNCYYCKTEYGTEDCKECIIAYFENKAKEVQ